MFSPTSTGVFESLKKIEKRFGFKSEIKWANVFVFFTFHILGFYWIYLYAFPVKWKTVIITFISISISGTGITCGVHRLWTHKCYKAKFPLKFYLMLTFSSTGQNTIYEWVRDHRLHHKFSDTEADPHNANRGFIFSHVGWLMMKKNQHVLEKGRQIDMSDILEDPIAMFQWKYAPILRILLSIVVPVLIGMLICNETWQCVVAWLYYIRIIFVFHSEMTVNSFAHIFGGRPYNNNIRPAENNFVSAVTGGEGYHNYHHMFPNDYKASETFEIFSVATFMIRLWAKLGLAYDLKEPSPQLIQAVINKRREQKEEQYVEQQY